MPGGKPAETVKPPKGTDEVRVPSPATLVVSLPADAKLLVNDVPTTSTSATRIFVTPTLNPGKDYHYDLTAEVIRDGQKVMTTQQVAVRAGEETRVQIEMPAATVAAN